MVNSSGDRVRAGLSAVPNINFSTAEHGSKKRTAQGTLRYYGLGHFAFCCAL